jgi:hypothetical protein
MSKYLKWAGLFLLVLITGTLVEVYLLKQKEEVGISYSNLGQEHIAVGAAHSAYNSNPPLARTMCNQRNGECIVMSYQTSNWYTILNTEVFGSHTIKWLQVAL